MGILKVGVGAAQGVLADSWREYFYCDAMDVDVLAKKGEQRQSKRGFNTKKSENIISNGSIVVVNEGQCMMIVEQGKAPKQANFFTIPQQNPACSMEI